MPDLPDFVVPRGPVPWADPHSDPLGDVRRALDQERRLAGGQAALDRGDALVASGGWCAPAVPTYSFFDLSSLGLPDLSWWWDTDVDAWLAPRFTAAQRALKELRRRLVVAARVLHHGYGWRAEPPDPDLD